MLESYNTSFKDCQEMIGYQRELVDSILKSLPSQFRKEGKTKEEDQRKEEDDCEKKENLDQTNKMID